MGHWNDSQLWACRPSQKTDEVVRLVCQATRQ
jgi:hypothetical protein